MNYKEFESILTREFPGCTEETLQRFQKLDALYRDWNSRINVISRKDMDGLYSHHVLHSLAIAVYMKRNGGFPAGSSVLDLGTGGGFPGIPLAILHPELSFTLCDSIGKKIKVASGVSEALGLGNVECVNARAESLGRKFDWVVSRAVTSLDNFLPWVKGSYNRGILYLKGGDISAEIDSAVAKCGLRRDSVELWNISEWLDDEWFSEKYVVGISRQGEK